VKKIAAGAAVAGLGVLVAMALWPAPQHTPSAALPANPPVVTVAPAARDVTPPGIVPGPAVEGPLTRLAMPAPPPPPPRWHRFFRPLIVEAGLFEVKGRSIRLRGLDRLPADTRCVDDRGSEWPCGRTALMELRRLVRGRAIECSFSSGGAEDVLVVPCRVASTDLALWMAEHGWARPAADAAPEIHAAARGAQCAGRGIWRGQAAAEPCA
jgi:endonuclease YncB( thermonuclease family)